MRSLNSKKSFMTEKSEYISQLKKKKKNAT